MAQSNQPFTVPPPVYEDTRPASKQQYGTTDQDPLLGGGNSRPRQQPQPWDEEEGFPEADFKPHVAQSSAEVRHAFVRKVYSTLFVQILGSAVFGALLRQDAAQTWVMENTWTIWVALIGTFGSLFACRWKAQSYPTNYAFLGLFTLFESFMIGSAVSFYDQAIVLQALIVTLFIFVGLTLFTFQSKYDFSSLGPWLFTALLAVIGVSVLNIFMPFGRVQDAVFAGIVVLIFCGFCLYDTHALMNRLSPDDHILASITLYLDVVKCAVDSLSETHLVLILPSLFLWILRLLNDIQRD